VLFGWVVVAVVWKGAALFAGAVVVAVEVEGCPNAKLSIKLAHSKHLLGASPLPSHAAGFAHRFSPLVVSLSARAVHRCTSHAHLTSDEPLIASRMHVMWRRRVAQGHPKARSPREDCTAEAG